MKCLICRMDEASSGRNSMLGCGRSSGLVRPAMTTLDVVFAAATRQANAKPMPREPPTTKALVPILAVLYIGDQRCEIVGERSSTLTPGVPLMEFMHVLSPQIGGD